MRPQALKIEYDAEPEDTYNLVYIIYLFYGIGFLTPWNCLLNCMDFLILKVSKGKTLTIRL